MYINEYKYAKQTWEGKLTGRYLITFLIHFKISYFMRVISAVSIFPLKLSIYLLLLVLILIHWCLIVGISEL